jgi:hypothetical protein
VSCREAQWILHNSLFPASKTYIDQNPGSFIFSRVYYYLVQTSLLRLYSSSGLIKLTSYNSVLATVLLQSGLERPPFFILFANNNHSGIACLRTVNSYWPTLIKACLPLCVNLVIIIQKVCRHVIDQAAFCLTTHFLVNICL